MPIGQDHPFKRRQHPGELIILCVRLYLRYPLSYEHVAEMVAERGMEASRCRPPPASVRNQPVIVRLFVVLPAVFDSVLKFCWH